MHLRRLLAAWDIGPSHLPPAALTAAPPAPPTVRAATAAPSTSASAVAPDMRPAPSKADDRRDRRARRAAAGAARRLSLATVALVFFALASAAVMRGPRRFALSLPSAFGATARAHSSSSSSSAKPKPRGAVAAAAAAALRRRSRAGSQPVSHPLGSRPLEEEWRDVIATFMASAPTRSFSTKEITRHYKEDVNNAQNTTMLVMLRGKQLRFRDNFNGRSHGRSASVRYILRKIVRERGGSTGLGLARENLTFPVMVTDGHRPRIATFGSARHWRNWGMLVPAPLGNQRGVALGWGTPLQAWDAYVRETVTSTRERFPWRKKIAKALFRGSLSMQSYTLGSCNAENGSRCSRAYNWSEVNRGVMFTRTLERQDLFNVGFTSLKPKASAPSDQMEGAPVIVPPVKFPDFQRYKMLLNVGSNQDWAERLRALLFTNSAVVVHEAETQEFFTPLLQAWVHYIPTDVSFSDLVENVEWAVKHDGELQRIVKRANEFAHRYISEQAMQSYWEVAMQEFARRQTEADSDDIA